MILNRDRRLYVQKRGYGSTTKESGSIVVVRRLTTRMMGKDTAMIALQAQLSYATGNTCAAKDFRRARGSHRQQHERRARAQSKCTCALLRFCEKKKQLAVRQHDHACGRIHATRTQRKCNAAEAQVWQNAKMKGRASTVLMLAHLLAHEPASKEASVLRIPERT